MINRNVVIVLSNLQLYFQNGNTKNRCVQHKMVQDFINETAKRGRRCVRNFETSSKTGANVDALFESVARDHLEDPAANENLRAEDPLSLDDTNPRWSFLCCRIS